VLPTLLSNAEKWMIFGDFHLKGRSIEGREKNHITPTNL
jgi:hypothetical protein